MKISLALVMFIVGFTIAVIGTCRPYWFSYVGVHDMQFSESLLLGLVIAQFGTIILMTTKEFRGTVGP